MPVLRRFIDRPRIDPRILEGMTPGSGMALFKPCFVAFPHPSRTQNIHSRAHSEWLGYKRFDIQFDLLHFIKRFEDMFLYLLFGSGSATFFRCSCPHGTYHLSFIIHSLNFLCFRNLCDVNSPWVKTRPGQVP